jgi:hypothetical protein
MNWSQVIAILIGAVLAIVTASITKYVTDWYDSRVRRSQISRFLAAELSSCVSKIESLLSIYKESKVPDPTFLLALERAATLFQGRREMVYLLDVNIGQQVLRFYDEIDNAVDMIMSMLRLIQESEHKNFASSEVQKQIENLERAYALGSELAIHFHRRQGKPAKLLPERPLS